MSDSAPEVDASSAEEIPTIELGADAPESFDSARSAAEALIKARGHQPAEAPEATADDESSQEDGDPEKAPAEEPESADPETPPIERPRSWSKDDDDDWNALPRARQEKIAANERARETDIRQRINEIADQRKAVEAQREAADKVRQQYEAQLPALMQTLQDAHQAAFSDIRTMDDVAKLQNEDPFRFQAWQVQQMKLQAATVETQRIAGEKTKTEQNQWAQHVQKENELASEYIPELADKTKGPALTQRAADRLGELGFKSEELTKLASGQEKLSIYDHRIQRLIFSDLKLSDIQAAKTAVAAKPLPTVQRPGIAKPSGNSEQIKTLTDTFNNSGDYKDAAELLIARRSSRRAS